MTRLGAVLAAQLVGWALIFAGVGQAATAEVDREDGFLTAYAYTLFPSAARVRLDPRDDAPDDLALVTGFRRGLERRGHIVDSAATLVLSFDLGIEDDVSLVDRRGGTATTGDAVVVRVGPPEGIRSRPSAGELVRYRLSVAVDDRRTGRRVWSGDLLFAANDRGHLSAAQAVLPVLLDSLGQTVNRLSITFD